ncbi:MAG: substrate-binding domain-containing protein, partial [Pseudarthrobacter sp.]
AAFREPPLTMIEQPMRELGVAAAQQLLDRIGGDTSAPRQHVLPSTLIARSSDGPAPSRAAK